MLSFFAKTFRSVPSLFYSFRLLTYRQNTLGLLNPTSRMLRLKSFVFHEQLSVISGNGRKARRPPTEYTTQSSWTGSPTGRCRSSHAGTRVTAARSDISGETWMGRYSGLLADTRATGARSDISGETWMGMYPGLLAQTSLRRPQQGRVGM